MFRSIGHLLFRRIPTRLARAFRGMRAANGPTAGHPIGNILVLRLDNLGDVVMSTPIFREIKRCFPGARLTVLVQERCREIIETNPYIDGIVVLKPAQQGALLGDAIALLSTVTVYVRHLRRIGFDLVLHPRVGSDVMHESLLVALIGAPVSIGYRDGTKGKLGEAERNRVLTRILEQPKPQHEVLSNAAVVSAGTHVEFIPKTELFLRKSDLAFAARKFELLPGDGLVVALAIGATIGRRRWPSSKWAETMQMLARRYSLSVVVLSTQADEEEANWLCSTIGENAISVVGACTTEVAACIRRATMFMGTDSGLAHIAAALSVPVVVVSPHPRTGDRAHYNSPVRFAPYGELVRVIAPLQGLPPCDLSCHMQTAHCILQIAPDEVLDACIELLESSGHATYESRDRRS
jgi:ADP-heptose:LPS heptosyltransferase